MEIIAAFFLYFVMSLYGLIEMVVAIFVRFLYRLVEFGNTKTGNIAYNSIAAILLITVAGYTLT